MWLNQKQKRKDVPFKITFTNQTLPIRKNFNIKFNLARNYHKNITEHFDDDFSLACLLKSEKKFCPYKFLKWESYRIYIIHSYHDMCFVTQYSFLFLLGYEQHFIKEKKMPQGFCPVHPESSFCDKLTISCKVLPLL